MIRALYSAASGMTAQQLNVDNIANNLANASTAGYKMRRAQFQDLLYQSMVQPGASAGQQTTVPQDSTLAWERAASNDYFHARQFRDQQSARPVDPGEQFFHPRPSGETA
jgi:flagellar basal-body rod protein FlgG